MPFALLVIGLILIVTGFQNTYAQFGAQLDEDFTGQNNFFYWVIAIGLIGALGYIKSLQGFSRAVMALILIAMFLTMRNGSAQGAEFFSSFNSQLSAGTTTAPLPAGGSAGATTGGSGASGSSGGGLNLGSILNSAGSLVSTVAKAIPLIGSLF